MALFPREDVERDIAPLPQSMARIAMDSGGQPQSGQHGAAPGLVLIPGEGGDNLLRGALLQLLHEADDSLGRFRFNQQVKVLRHQHPADQEEAGFLAELTQRLDKGPAKALTREEPAAAIGAGGNELQLAGLEMASIDRHERNIGGRGQGREWSESQSWARSG